MSGTRSFSAGNITLSGWVSNFVSDSGTIELNGVFALPLGENFVWNWTAPTFNVLTNSPDARQVISGSGSDKVSLSFQFGGSIVFPPRPRTQASYSTATR
jgi:hypothetical protein